ncbi:protein NEN4 isoform X3 [Cucumis melo var. makuwa]|uniref:Protein NEN4 isoform X3 n=2 Tax=Cucumis melo TaxID=3656 RepID=A0A5D3CL58_CUCMM|nr:protein NEN4 isoform X2 [Cucumis melo]KAA0036283.1 protein NEN4 isoform X3 [Cucumis melo var. makuwa]TYK12677.1 protein NEN4 isoform X3 [Cucumis melo var. makuwa]
MPMDMEASCSFKEGATEIVFFDLETTVPKRVGQRFRVLEFGAIVVCPMKLVELESFATLIKPTDLSAVALRSSRPDGITREAVATAPLFEDVADKIFSILNGRIWAGHNIRRFDCVRIKEAFAEIGRPAPTPVGMVDSLGVLTNKFGKRAGNMKMASLASYFQLGQQKHRSLDDVRMNLEVLKHCATVLFLESTLPSILQDKWKTSPTKTTRNRANGKLHCREESSRKSPPSSPGYQLRSVPYSRERLGIGKMTAKVKNVLYMAQGKQHLNVLLKHSRSLLR